MNHLRNTGILRAAAETHVLELPGMAACAIQVSGTFVGTLVFEVSITKDTWTTLNVTAPNSTSTVTGATAVGLWSGSVAGMHALRVRCSAFTSGVINVDLLAAAAGASGGGGGGGASGGTSSAFSATFPGDGTAVGGYNASSGLMKPFAIDDSGNVKVVVSGAGSAVTVADGADVTQGALADAAVGDATGTVNAHLRFLASVFADVWVSASHFLKVSIQNATLAVTQSGSWVLSAGSAVIGHVITDSGSTTAVTGNVATTVADAANVTLGAKADAKSTATDTTPITAMSVWKQISASVQSLVTGTVLAAGSALIGNVGDGKTHKSKTGAASATFTIVAAVTSKKLKVYRLSLMMTSATAVTVTFKDGASGTAIGTYLLQAPASVVAGIAEAVSVPSSLFETTAGNLLEMAFSAAVSVTYNLSYWDDDAT